jgi:hypothetical protein
MAVEGLVLSGSLSSLWSAFLSLLGLFACLDFGPCPLFLLNLKTKKMQIFFPQANLKAIHLKL